MAITVNSCAHCNDCDDLLTETQRRMNSTESGGGAGYVAGDQAADWLCR